MTEMSIALSREVRPADPYPSQPGRNRLIQSLSPSVLSVLVSQLDETQFEKGKLLHEAGEPVADIYFPQSGLILITSAPQTDRRLCLALTGRDNGVGLSAAFGSPFALNSAYVQVPGAGYRISARRFQNLVQDNAELRDAVVRSNDALLDEIQQSVICNALHDLPSRLCRVLLRARDLLSSDVIPITQTELSQLLGVQRTSITLVSTILQADDVLRTFRGRIVIQNVGALERRACECSSVVRRSVERLFESDAAETVSAPHLADA